MSDSADVRAASASRLATQTSLEHLVAVEEIKKLEVRYFRDLDMKNWEDFPGASPSTLLADQTGATAPNSSSQLDEIVVTARKREPGNARRDFGWNFVIRGVYRNVPKVAVSCG
jgi:hypothetical protein